MLPLALPLAVAARPLLRVLYLCSCDVPLVSCADTVDGRTPTGGPRRPPSLQPFTDKNKMTCTEENKAHNFRVLAGKPDVAIKILDN